MNNYKRVNTQTGEVIDQSATQKQINYANYLRKQLGFKEVSYKSYSVWQMKKVINTLLRKIDEQQHQVQMDVLKDIDRFVK